jgi:hypothetical protein
MVRPGLPPLDFYVSAQWMAYHEYSPVTSKWSVNFGVTTGSKSSDVAFSAGEHDLLNRGFFSKARHDSV